MEKWAWKGKEAREVCCMGRLPLQIMEVQPCWRILGASVGDAPKFSHLRLRELGHFYPTRPWWRAAQQGAGASGNSLCFHPALGRPRSSWGHRTPPTEVTGARS